MKTRISGIILIMSLLASMGSAFAADKVHRRYRFDATEIEQLELDIPVGTLRFEPGNSNTVEVDVVIEGRSGWIPFFDRSPNLNEVEVSSQQSAGLLHLKLDEDNVSSDWIVRIPELERVEVNFGVGTIGGRLLAGYANIDMGVGSIALELDLESTGEIDLSAGVGDTMVQGSVGNSSNRSLVSSSSSARGGGQRPFSASLGVGDIDIRLISISTVSAL